MNKYETKLVLISLVMACATNVYAGYESDNGIIIGIDTGRAEAHKFCDGLLDCNNDDTSVRVNIGYQFNNTWSAEFGYTSFGTLFDSNDNNFLASQDSNAWTFSGVGTLPLGELFDLYGRAGVARYETDSSGTVQGVPVKNHKDVKPYVGAGVNFNFTHHFALRLEYQVYTDISRADGSDDDVQGLYAGASYRF